MAKQEKSPRTRLPAGVKAAFAVLAMGAAALFGGCENETTPETRQTVFQLNHGFTVEDQTGGALNGGHIGVINEYLDLLNSQDAAYISILKNNNLKILVITGSNVSRSGDTISVGINNITNVIDFGGAVDDYFFYWLSFINNFNTNIHLAKGNAEAPGTLFG